MQGGICGRAGRGWRWGQAQAGAGGDGAPAGNPAGALPKSWTAPSTPVYIRAVLTEFHRPTMKSTGSSRTLLFFLLLGGLATGGALAVPPASNPTVSKALADELKLQEHSSGFVKPEGDRNPFWPVAWKPGDKPVEQKKEVTKVNPLEIFNISSILLGPPDLVIINGKRYETGQVIPVAVGENRLEFQILKIQDGGVVMRVGNQQFVLPKRRINPDSANR
jgi:hypothetical protein